MPNQYENQGNPRAHYRTTAPEIWKQMGGRIDAVVAGIGTGGTISGIGRYLKKKNKDILIVGVDPEGSIYYNLKNGTKFLIHQYLTEGIGEDFLPKTYDGSLVDEVIRVGDAEGLLMARRLAREEGILAGGSSGTAVAGAIRLAKKRKDLRDVVVILPDTGRNYLAKLFNDKWMESHGFTLKRKQA